MTTRAAARLLSLATVLSALALTSTRTAAQTTTVAEPSAGSAPARPALRVGALRGDIRLDGVLGEPAWVDADSIADLTQTEPRMGATPSGRTVVRVLASETELLIGIRADYPPEVGIVSFARNRDAGLGSEDHVRIVLDTYRDGRSGYVFAVSANGARYDALISDQGGGENSSWDAVWEAATARTATGWSAEIRIPLKSLLFRTGLTEWGFNVQRRIQGLQETMRWASPQRDYKVTQTSRAGLLTDLPRFDLGIGLSVRPSMTAGAGVPARDSSLRRRGDASLDVTQRLGANTLASLTVNTDFAETEVDTRRTNLTRFPISFPEKRTFFLEGSDVFDFGTGLGDIRPFFSRRIGLSKGRSVPLEVGGKVTGKLGGTSFGALVARTGQLDTLPTDNTMGVVRLRQNVLQESTIGVLAAAGDPQGRSGSWLAGTDWTYRTSRFRGDKNFLLGLWGLETDYEGLAGKRHALGARIAYPNDEWDASLAYRWIGDGFQPSLGFVPRAGIQSVNLSINQTTRPRRPIAGLRVRKMDHEFQPSLTTDLEGRWESYRIFTAPINWQLESGDRFEFNVVPTGERLTRPFEIADGVVIPAGAYHYNRFRLEGGLASKRRFSGQATWWFGPFYTGTLDQIELSAAWKPSALFILELTGERNIGRLHEGAFTQDLVGSRFRINVSPDLQLNSFLQYDNESHSFGTNSRLRWTFSPLGELFVVYNHNLARPVTLDATSRRLAFASNELLVKVQYAFRY